MVADALIYHPTVSHYLKFIATTGTYKTHLCYISSLMSTFTLLLHMLPLQPIRSILNLPAFSTNFITTR